MIYVKYVSIGLCVSPDRIMQNDFEILPTRKSQTHDDIVTNQGKSGEAQFRQIVYVSENTMNSCMY